MWLKHVKKTLEITLHKIWSAFFTWPSAPNIITLTKFTSLSLKTNMLAYAHIPFYATGVWTWSCYQLSRQIHITSKAVYTKSSIVDIWWGFEYISDKSTNNNYIGLVCSFCAKLKCIKWKYSGMDQLKYVVDGMTKFETT